MSVSTPPALGSFALLEPIGVGGMGVVWKAVHVDYDVHVAIKILSPTLTSHVRTAEIFRNEIRAIARLDHPCIPRVFDAGKVPAEVAQATEGALADGAAWLAMEYADGGTLDVGNGPKDWPALRELLFGLLDALAHAHARGVIHRDIKPSNLLWSGASRVLLADFGLADLRLRGGTPGFAAPEQLSGGMQGPWTDNHALGITALQLASGMPVPADFDAWTARMCAPEPSDRFQSAAEASQHLRALSSEASSLLGAVSTDGADAMTVLRAVDAAEAAQAFPHGIGSLPESWEVEHTPRTLHLQGTGLGLLDLREPRTVGRLAARDALWAALLAVERSGKGMVHVLEGSRGSGRTHLATWLQQRARELGSRTEVRQIGFATDAPATEPGVLKIVRQAVYDAPGGIVLDPLPEDEAGALVRETLGLTPALTGWIVHTGAGHPGAIVSLIHQVAKDPSLTLTPGGFALGGDVPPELSQSDTALYWPSPPVRIQDTALHFLAVLGIRGELECWRRGLAELQEREVDLIPLIEAGILSCGDDRWSFTDPFARQAVLDRLPTLLASRLYGVAASVLEGPEAALAHLRAGQPERALEAILALSEDGAQGGLCSWLMTHASGLLESLAVPEEDPRWGRIWLAQAQVLGSQQEGAEVLAKRVLVEGRKHGWGPLLARAAHRLAKDLEQRGDLLEARDLMEKAREAFERIGDRDNWVLCTVQLADLHGALGRSDAVSVLDEVLPNLERSWLAWVLVCKARLLADTPKEAIATAQKASRLLEDFPRTTSNLGTRANALSAEGDAHRLLGDPTQAAKCYRRAHTLYTAAGRSADAITCVLNLAINELQAGNYAAARDALAAPTTAGTRGKHLRAAIALLLATAEAGRGDWEAHDRHFAEAVAGLTTTGFVDADLAEMAELAASLSEGERAQRCLALARTQRQRLEPRTPVE